MAKPEWGVKRTCLSCGARFYDLQREPIVCPACGASVDAAAQSKPRRARATPATKVAAVPAVEVTVAAAVVEDDVDLDSDLEEEEEVEEDEEIVEAEAAEDEGEDEDEGESAIEDVSELGDDDMADVIDTEIDEEETNR